MQALLLITPTVTRSINILTFIHSLSLLFTGLSGQPHHTERTPLGTARHCGENSRMCGSGCVVTDARRIGCTRSTFGRMQRCHNHVGQCGRNARQGAQRAGQGGDTGQGVLQQCAAGECRPQTEQSTRWIESRRVAAGSIETTATRCGYKVEGNERGGYLHALEVACGNSHTRSGDNSNNIERTSVPEMLLAWLFLLLLTWLLLWVNPIRRTCYFKWVKSWKTFPLMHVYVCVCVFIWQWCS